MKLLTSCALALLQLIPLNAFAQSLSYKFVDLGPLPIFDFFEPISVNNKGQIVGVGSKIELANMRTQAIIFDPTGNCNHLDMSYANYNTASYCINDQSVIVGYVQAQLNSEHTMAIFDPAIGSVQPHSNLKSAYGINNYGLIAGSFENQGLPVAAKYDLNSGIATNLGSISGCDYSEARIITNKGTIVGYAGDSEVSFRAKFAVRFDPTGNGNNITLATNAGYTYSMPYGVNENDEIVGTISKYAIGPFTFDEELQAVLFDFNGSGNNILLGTLADYTNSQAIDINNRGQIVGRAIKDYLNCAVIFDSTGQGNNININDLILPEFDYFADAAIAINDNGWIVGIGYNSANAQTAFLLIEKKENPADFDDDGDVDLADFAIFADAWQSHFYDKNWNGMVNELSYEVFGTRDDVIDSLDLQAFAGFYIQ